MKQLITVITGDIIKSRDNDYPELWIKHLKTALEYLNPNVAKWELFRGDSFQIELEDYTNGFLAVVLIKASVKMIKELDVRMAIGIGNTGYKGETISESNGEAFIFSGETFETLKQLKQNLRIKTHNQSLNEELNLYFKLASVTMDNWTANSAEIVKLSIQYPKLMQEALGKLVGVTQSTVSQRQKRAHLEVLMELNKVFKQKITIL